MRVLIIGAGGLGSPVALALARAAGALLSGLTLVDPDRVEPSNLHRQLLHGKDDLGRLKVDSGADRLRALLPKLRLESVAARITPENAAALLADHALVVEGSDDLPTKFLVNDTALAAGIPAVIGGVVRWSGQILTVMPAARAATRTACYRCLFEEPPSESAASCDQAGVLGPACGVVGGVMAVEVMRILRGQPPRHAQALWVADLLAGRIRSVKLNPRPGCPACAQALQFELSAPA